ncbi:uncharacterized protein FLJ37310-like [Schistocerca gregaria]|uniref:uncharacterized protein FLJ37310-like n=1 Tax=Schistocerca gregaria TaxID=7010 RepID=UPI00211F1DDC|nr:uncharacterized protein FLJ37310-like [Schistocerca gregaria]
MSAAARRPQMELGDKTDSQRRTRSANGSATRAVLFRRLRQITRRAVSAAAPAAALAKACRFGGRKPTLGAVTGKEVDRCSADKPAGGGSAGGLEGGGSVGGGAGGGGSAAEEPAVAINSRGKGVARIYVTGVESAAGPAIHLPPASDRIGGGEGDVGGCALLSGRGCPGRPRGATRSHETVPQGERRQADVTTRERAAGGGQA